ncbi:MAG TPA: hypothetical protein VHR84_13350 [Terriglobales bacterium]|jgi:hypothetical protein|nr:hypothetical protein [Terriglobales bacterium]
MTHATAPAIQKTAHPMRRSERLPMHFAVLVTSLSPRVVARPLERNTPVLLDLIVSGRSRRARVVDAVALGEADGWLLGLEFDEPANIWGVSPSPPSWPK